MSIEEKIINYLREETTVGNKKFGKVQVAKDKNKNGQTILFIKATSFENRMMIYYSNYAIYYGFDEEGNYLGSIVINILNMQKPNTVEMEYWGVEQFQNRGNITILAREAIEDIFSNQSFDGLKVKENRELSHIDTIMVSINKDNFPSLAIAQTLGFNSQGYLTKEEYYRLKGKPKK